MAVTISGVTDALPVDVLQGRLLHRRSRAGARRSVVFDRETHGDVLVGVAAASGGGRGCCGDRCCRTRWSASPCRPGGGDVSQSRGQPGSPEVRLGPRRGWLTGSRCRRPCGPTADGAGHLGFPSGVRRGGRSCGHAVASRCSSLGDGGLAGPPRRSASASRAERVRASTPCLRGWVTFGGG